MLLIPHLLEDILAKLLEEDVIFGSYIDARHLEQVVGVCIVYFVTINCDLSHTFGHGLYSTYSLAHAQAVLGACFLTTYSHKCICLLIRVCYRVGRLYM